METKEKLKKILTSIKIDVSDLDKFEKDTNAILKMFDDLKSAPVENISDTLEKKDIKLIDLREDEVKPSDFRKDMRGKYFIVPNVSKKTK